MQVLTCCKNATPFKKDESIRQKHVEWGVRFRLTLCVHWVTVGGLIQSRINFVQQLSSVYWRNDNEKST
ncbi:MAG: hypothetical protein KDI11_03320, partial [Alphaproteobacteria bacterium]|nr:hypothetical protein [Alphaproteobacteria bacterium]